jgi:hypothetical protein
MLWKHDAVLPTMIDGIVTTCIDDTISLQTKCRTGKGPGAAHGGTLAGRGFDPARTPCLMVFNENRVMESV